LDVKSVGLAVLSIGENLRQAGTHLRWPEFGRQPAAQPHSRGFISV